MSSNFSRNILRTKQMLLPSVNGETSQGNNVSVTHVSYFAKLEALTQAFLFFFFLTGDMQRATSFYDLFWLSCRLCQCGSSLNEGCCGSKTSF